MHRTITTWWSPNLGKDMEIVAYGHYGPALLMFPSAAADFLEYERFHLIEAIRPFIEAGKIKVYSINSINSESWLNDHMHGREKVVRHQHYNQYVVDEVVPFIYRDCDGEVPIVTSGVSLGAFHAANTFFRRPDVFDGPDDCNFLAGRQMVMEIEVDVEEFVPFEQGFEIDGAGDGGDRLAEFVSQEAL